MKIWEKKISHSCKRIWIRICISWKSGIRIRISWKSGIRIRIKTFWIRHTGASFGSWETPDLNPGQRRPQNTVQSGALHINEQSSNSLTYLHNIFFSFLSVFLHACLVFLSEFFVFLFLSFSSDFWLSLFFSLLSHQTVRFPLLFLALFLVLQTVRLFIVFLSLSRTVRLSFVFLSVCLSQSSDCQAFLSLSWYYLALPSLSSLFLFCMSIFS